MAVIASDTGRPGSSPAASPPPPSTLPPARRAAHLAGLAIVLGTALALKLPVCPFAAITHHPCPGCGLTRATVALLRGDVHAALHFHPLVVVVSPILAVVVTAHAVSYVRRGRAAVLDGLPPLWATALVSLLAVVLVAVWIARFFGAFGGPAPV